MRVVPTAIDGPLIIEPDVHGDDRGFFLESWNAQDFAANGIHAEFVQDNHSRSDRGVLRGLHFQNPQPQGKLVRVVSGAVYDVAVDLRQSSPSFGKWIGVGLTAENKRMLWVPGGFAHGFLTLKDGTDLLYKCDAPYAPQHEHVLAWDDPTICVDWPTHGLDLRLSEKDRNGIALAKIGAFA